MTRSGTGIQNVIMIKEVCSLLLTTNLSNRQIGRRLGIGYNTARRYRRRLADENLTWADVAALDEEALASRINDGRLRMRRAFVEPDWAHVYEEMQRRGVTLTLLHEEYDIHQGDAPAASPSRANAGNGDSVGGTRWPTSPR